MNAFSATLEKKPVPPPNSGLTPYGGVWDRKQVTHLLRRTMFGATKADVDYFLGKTLSQTVAELLSTAVNTNPAPPLNYYSYAGCNSDNIDPKVNFGDTWVNSSREPGGQIDNLRAQSVKAWWMGRMLNQDRSILEKMVLFWHNHMPVSAAGSNDARNLYTYNSILRKYALGNFKTMIKDITINPGMLFYLNGNVNVAGSPDENYARELQELFCVGKGAGAGYTEDDVKAAARVLTGWNYNTGATPPVGINFAARHDTKDKLFSAFYNNTTIKGSTDANKELDDLLNMIFATNEVAKFIARKVYTFFVYYEITPQIEEEVITPMADIFRSNNYNIVPVLDALFKSEHFFDLENKSCLIRPGIDYIVGMCRETQLQFPTNTVLEAQYQSWLMIVGYANAFQQNLLDPPNVAGWPAYYQSPQYHELWINAITIQARKDVVGRLVAIAPNNVNGANISIRIVDPNDPTKNTNKLLGYLKIDLIKLAKSSPNASDPNVLVEGLCSLMLGYDVSSTTKAAMKKAYLLANQTADTVWTNAWNAFVADETNVANKKVVEDRLKALFGYSTAIPEYQLC